MRGGIVAGLLALTGCNQILGVPEPSHGTGDGGVDAASIDATPIDARPIDATIDANPCGNNMVQSGETCDGTDLAGQSCTNQGFPAGGMLACNATCTGFVTSACMAPPAPTVRRPLNGTYLGTRTVPGSMRPNFVWSPVTWAGTGPITYELQFSTDATFATGVTTVPTATASHRPAADLAVAQVAPVGARYAWRVRSCFSGVCSPYSAVWRVNVGRSDRDFNGDGFADIVAGAPGNAGTGSGLGRAYVYFGGAGAFDTTADGTLTGAAALDYFGAWVAAAGDLNGDGFTDVVVGAHFNDAGGADAGRAYVYLGGAGATFDTTADGVLTGFAAGDYFGGGVGAAGDINGDGFGDLIIGANNNDAGGADAGRAYLYLGGAGNAFDITVDGTVTGAAAGDEFGKYVATAGDVNGDGFDDVLVGAWLNDATGNAAGRAYVYFGAAGTTIDSTADGVLSGAAAGDNFGTSVAPAGDVNGDGFADIVIGASNNDAPGGDAGRAYVYFGGAGAVLETTADGTLNGLAATGYFGYDVASAGDVNGDGFDDVVVGAYYVSGQGAAYVYVGAAGATFDGTNDGALGGPAGHFGFAVASAGDVDGDGFDDVVVGAYVVSGLTGAIYLYRGGAGGTFNTTVDASKTGAAAGDQLGYSVD